jgi:hypothetical protein
MSIKSGRRSRETYQADPEPSFLRLVPGHGHLQAQLGDAFSDFIDKALQTFTVRGEWWFVAIALDFCGEDVSECEVIVLNVYTHL